MEVDAFAESHERHEALAKYARLYAQHRTLPFIVQFGVFLALCGAVGGSSLGTAYAVRSGNPALIACGVALMIFVTGVVIWVSVPRWGGRRLWRLGTSLYRHEGQTCVEGPSKIVWPRWGYLLVPALVAFLMAQFGLTSHGWLPVRFAEPISAVYFAPFCYGMYRVQRPMIGIWLLMVPVLYVMVGVLVLVGVPLASDNISLFWLNVYAPMFGSQIVAMIGGHLYSRYALKRIKALAHVEAPEQIHE